MDVFKWLKKKQHSSQWQCGATSKSDQSMYMGRFHWLPYWKASANHNGTRKHLDMQDQESCVAIRDGLIMTYDEKENPSILRSYRSAYFVTHMVFWHWLTRVSRSSSLWGLTVMSSRVWGLAQNSRLAGSTLRLVQLARLMRPIGFW